VGKASRRKRSNSQRVASPSRSPARLPDQQTTDLRSEAEAALLRLFKISRPGKVSLASAYAVGYAALGVALQEGDAPEWYDDLDPLEVLFLGTAWPGRFLDSFEFANACAAWLRMMRSTRYWPGIERFVEEALAASEEHDLPVDEGELMLLLNGRLESAGLNQRQLPRDLLPDRALQGSRFLGIQPEDVDFPEPPPDADKRVAEFWASCEVDLPSEATTVDALREGLQILMRAGVDVQGNSIVLLLALYIALAAGDDEIVSESGGRAAAWALGLNEDSPLVPVADVLLAAVDRELEVDAVLGHMFGIDAFTQAIRPEDRVWRSSPGHSLVGLAFGLGHRRVVTRDAKVVRLDEEGAALLEYQRRRFEEKFGRPIGPDDPVFFDPDADEPQPLSMLDVESDGVAMLEAAGVSPAWIYAHQHTEGLLPRPDGTFVSERDEAEWNDAVERYVRLHQPDIPVDHDTEVSKFQGLLLALTLEMLADDPDYAASLAARLVDPNQSAAEEESLIRPYLEYRSDELLTALRADPALSSRACEYARAWSGADLADRVRVAAEDSELDEELDVLLAVAVAAARDAD
jgi:hypothetical protein